MIRLKPSRSEQVRFAAAFLAVNVLAPNVLARQQARTCLVDARALRYGREKLTGGKGRGPTPQVRATSLMGPYAMLATRYVVRSDGIQSAANQAVLMAPEDQKSMHPQRLEGSNFRRARRLIKVLGKVRHGALEKKDVK